MNYILYTIMMNSVPWNCCYFWPKFSVKEKRQQKSKLIRNFRSCKNSKNSWIWVREAFNQIQSIPEMLCITPNPSTSVEQRYQCYLESVLASSDWHHFTAFYFTLSPPEFLAFITCSLRPDQMPHISWLNNN